jgi:hypothetical protein
MRSNLEIKTGDLVTLQLEEFNTASNVYVVVKNLGEESILNHPLYPEVLIMKPNSTLNKVLASIKNEDEKQLVYVTKNAMHFSYNDIAEIYSIIAYFIVNRKITTRQQRTLNLYSGKAAINKLNNNLSSAIQLVNKHKGILNDYNMGWYERYVFLYNGSKTPAPHQREIIFNQAGFVLAQLEEDLTKVGI